jgi:GDP-L-fucose synthase
MDTNSRIYVAGHRGLAGSALTRRLKAGGYSNIITRTREELDLTRQAEVESFFQTEKPDYVFLAAAKVGGIYANNTYKADFIYQNIMIAANVIHASYAGGVKKLLNLGSSCVYPRDAAQPLKEECLLSGPLESTNDAYAVAKITAIKLCRHYNEQYGTNFISVMPTNLYGPEDNFDFENSHVLPALIRRIYLGKLLMNGDFGAIRNNLDRYGKSKNCTAAAESEIYAELEKHGIQKDKVIIWGTGKPCREFMHSSDLADACVFLMEKYGAKELGEIINIGTGKDLTIKELAELIQRIAGYTGTLEFDLSKPDGVPRKLLDLSRLHALGWKEKTGLEEGIHGVIKELAGQRQ